MSINVMLYDHPLVAKAIDEASSIITSWADGVNEGEREAAKLATSGWDGVALMEAIARALLEREGIDDDARDLFEDLADEHPDKSLMDPRGALFELWDAERKERP
jgi:hypothetical protein